MVVSSSTSSVKATTVKFLCSYGGKILPRYTDGKLRYIGGLTRIFAVDRSLPFSELKAKLTETYSESQTLTLRCQLPDLEETLFSITSDEDLVNLYQEYDHLVDFKI